MQGLFEVAGIPYVGAGVLGSAIGMDKDVMKRLLRDAGIPVADFRTLRRDRFDADPQRVGAELAVARIPDVHQAGECGFVSRHPQGQGCACSSIDAIRYAFEFDSKVIVEAAVNGREIELAVLGGNPATVSVAGEIIVEHPDGFYSYDAKYIDEKGRAARAAGAHCRPTNWRGRRPWRCRLSRCSSAKGSPASTCS